MGHRLNEMADAGAHLYIFGQVLTDLIKSGQFIAKSLQVMNAFMDFVDLVAHQVHDVFASRFVAFTKRQDFSDLV